MLIAENKLTNERYFPYLEKNTDLILQNKENIICPFCKEKLILVNGIIKIVHFRHFIESQCSPEPETKEHIEMKQFFIDNLNLNKDSVEVNLRFARPDVFIKERNLAIEVQHSAISEEKFLERTTNYTNNGIYVLWVFDECLLGEANRISKLLKKAHELYFGRVYIFRENGIFPAHFNPVERWVEEREIPEYIEDFEEYKNNGFEPYFKKVGGYWKTLKTIKDVTFDDKYTELSIYNIVFQQNTWKNNNFLIAKLNEGMFWKCKQRI